MAKGSFEEFVLQHPLMLVKLAALFQVAAGAEGLIPGTCDDHAPEAVAIDLQRVKNRKKFVSALRVERVGRVGSVDGDPQYLCERFINEQRPEIAREKFFGPSFQAISDPL